MNRRRTQKRKDTVNDDEGKARRPPVTLFNWQTPHNFRVARLVPRPRNEKERGEGPVALRPLQRRNSVEFRDLYANMRRARDGSSGLYVFPSVRIRGLSHATQRALSRFSRGTLFSHTRRRSGRNTRAITCRYWSLIDAPGPSVDMPIIGLPRCQSMPARSISTRCYACAYRTGASTPPFQCKRTQGQVYVENNET